MLTVKEFKDLGGEFVIGDEFEAIENKSPTTVTRKVAEIFNDGRFPNVVILSFAWRPLNTLPDNPKFKHEVNTTQHQWRPLLDQSSVKPSDDKPVFTQAMADAGELPPVGSKFLHKGHAVLCISTTEHDGGVVTFRGLTQGNGPDIACCWNNKSWVKPILIPLDQRTPKQKTVDELDAHLNDIQCIKSSTQRHAVAVILVNLGYEKKC
jgi:hypothetical protein